MLCFHCVYIFRKTYNERLVFSLWITVVKCAGKYTVKACFPCAGKLGMNSIFYLWSPMVNTEFSPCFGKQENEPWIWHFPVINHFVKLPENKGFIAMIWTLVVWFWGCHKRRGWTKTAVIIQIGLVDLFLLWSYKVCICDYASVGACSCHTKSIWSI